MGRLAIGAFVLVLVGASAALAAEPKKRLNVADQKRARAMLLKQADVGLGYRAVPGGTSGNPLAPTCSALDESDLTVTGDAQSPYFTSGLQTFASLSEIYVSPANAGTAWRRTTSPAGLKCLTDILRKSARAGGVRFVSFRKVPFPSVATRTAAYRLQLLVNRVRLYEDFIVVSHGRADAAVIMISGIDPIERDEELRLARLVSNRMTKALRGA
jgi:hypothetical protein